MARSLDEQRYRKTYSYYRSQPQFRQESGGEPGNNSALLALDWKESVRAMANTNVSLAGSTPLVVDGCTLLTGESILLFNQSNPVENGIYYATIDGGAYTLQRSGDADTDTLSSGAVVMTTDGDLFAFWTFILTTPDPITVGSTPLTWYSYMNPGLSSLFVFSGNEVLCERKISFDISGRLPSNIGSDVFFFVSGSLDGSKKVAFGGDVCITGSLARGGGLARGLASHADGLAFALGERSHAEGKETSTVGYSSHAEGQSTVAVGENSHAEGFLTTTGGSFYYFSVTPGDTTVTIAAVDARPELDGATLTFVPVTPEGPQRPIEVFAGTYVISYDGTDTTIELDSPIDDSTSSGAIFNTDLGKYSHAEGESTRALGRSSHAEGYETIASGTYSHAQGIGTIASGSGQFVAGTYNLRGNDTSIFVIGNGNNDGDRSDILRIHENNFQVTGSLSLTGSLHISQGSNLPSGKITLDGGSPGTYTVNNTLVGSNSIILLTKQTFANPTGAVGVSSRVNGTSFTITSSLNGDTDEVGYLIINP